MVEQDETLPRKKPRQERARALVEALVEATARVLMTKNDAQDITTNEIAEVAGVSVGSLYQYFPNKESLLAALIERELDQDMASARQIIDAHRDRPLAELIRLLLKEFVDRTRPRSELHQKVLPLVDDLHRANLVQRERDAMSALFAEVMMDHHNELASRLTDGEDAPERIRCASFVTMRAMELSLNAVKVEAPELLEREELPDLLARIFETLMLEE